MPCSLLLACITFIFVSFRIHPPPARCTTILTRHCAVLLPWRWPGVAGPLLFIVEYSLKSIDLRANMCVCVRMCFALA